MAGHSKFGNSHHYDPMFYAYILQSIREPSQYYRGHTADLKTRVAEHNAGKSPHTAKFTPWKLVFYAALESSERAQDFERYLKSGSGHAFAKKHFGIG
jgi:putative endonuclease